MLVTRRASRNSWLLLLLCSPFFSSCTTPLSDTRAAGPETNGPLVTLPASVVWRRSYLSAPLVLVGRILSVAEQSKGEGAAERVMQVRVEKVLKAEPPGIPSQIAITEAALRRSGTPLRVDEPAAGERYVFFARPSGGSYRSIFEGGQQSIQLSPTAAFPSRVGASVEEALTRILLGMRHRKQDALFTLQYCPESIVTEVLQEVAEQDRETAPVHTACEELVRIAPHLDDCEAASSQGRSEAQRAARRARAISFLSALPHARMPDCSEPDGSSCLLERVKTMAQSRHPDLRSKACRILKERFFHPDYKFCAR